MEMIRMRTSKGRPSGVTKAESPLLRGYEEKVRTQMRVLLAEKNISQKEAARALEKAGVKETPKGLSSKLNAGTCSAAYYLAFIDTVNSM